MIYHILTLFPEMIEQGLGHSVIKRALDEKKIQLDLVNIRDFAGNKHNHVDDYPYGGGAGMVMQAKPIFDAYNDIKKRLKAPCPVIYMSPQGKPFNNEIAKKYSKLDEMVILCGHYEGVDERIIEEIVTEEISVGDYVLTGGELGAMIVVDATSRMIEGVLNKEESHQTDTFEDGLLEYPQYTRPPQFNGKSVPSVLISGNHKNVDKWRREQALKRTLEKRPDLLAKAKLSKSDKKYIAKLLNEAEMKGNTD